MQMEEVQNGSAEKAESTESGPVTVAAVAAVASVGPVTVAAVSTVAAEELSGRRQVVGVGHGDLLGGRGRRRRQRLQQGQQHQGAQSHL